MKRLIPLRAVAPLALLCVALSACKNDGQNPVVTDDKAATLSSPGNGAGNSPTGAAGGTATTPASGAGATPGSTRPATTPPTTPPSR